jgi:periplasmic protein TonB
MATTLGSGPASVQSEAPTDILFRDLVLSGSRRPEDRRVSWGVFSVAGHVIAVALLIVIPILWPEDLPGQDYVRALIFNPPPPPPPPLPKGSALVERNQQTKPVTPDPQPRTPQTLDAPVEDKPKPEDKAPEKDQFGSATGVDAGVPEGMDIGVVGGVVGGVPGGTVGGCIGCTGDGPVMDYDQPPKLIKETKPIYSQEGFVKKIEGVVAVEIVIDATGHVSRARVTQSIPALDASALECVRQWVFQPAMKHGRPVATIANAAVTFRIY